MKNVIIPWQHGWKNLRFWKKLLGC